MDQAERAVNKLLDKRLDARIMMPLIRTFSEKDSPECREKAWAAYRRMREHLGRGMKLSDYDQVVSYFLTTNQIENALYAFVDMMTDGRVDLKWQKYLPSVVANKFFLGKWLKRLIGAFDLDGAYSVIDFMRKKGVEASPMHLNGLIGAWQRSRTAANVEKADKLAWNMIEERIRFVLARESDGGGGEAEAVPSDAPWPRATVPSDAPWPRATLETFSLMAENYRSRDLPGAMEALWDAFRDAEISPDACMMNQLLESHIQAGRGKEVPALYQSMVTEQGHDLDRTLSSILAGGMPKRPKRGRTAVRNVSTETSPVSVDEVMTPGPEKRTFMCAFEKGASRHSGSRKYVTPLVQVSGMLWMMMSPSVAP
ncbi:pentatricopeptide repeat containing protein [Ophiocordyceps sinensis CO18]|uniref:Pentatricopeptide repeat containing protein n=1 Tax=Ophiocordyceps sinensis (strain Co18 / CGMCC 3.14243) TaxID=911162 RepID=T5ANV4_OPHSC|nr:pentatricopeptide repeat containing protein [Ophiocordyceps sinensis CO18]